MKAPPEHETVGGDTDILVGAAAIAAFMFGDPSMRRQVYYLVERGDLPHCRIRKRIYSTRSGILRMIDRLMNDNDDQSGSR